MRTLLQHFDVVIRFQNQHVAAFHALKDQLRGVAEIRQKANLSSSGAQNKTNWILGVMRDAKRFNNNVSNLKG